MRSNRSKSDTSTKNYDEIDSSYIDFLIELKHVVFNLDENNFELSIDQTMKLFDSNFHSFNSVIITLVYYAFCSLKKEIDIYIKYLETIQTKEEELNKNSPKIIETFSYYLSEIESHESYYIIEQMIERNLINSDIAKNIDSEYFAHYKPEGEYEKDDGIERCIFFGSPNHDFIELKKNDWELHKKYVKEGINQNEIVKIIRNDDIEKLQEMSSQPNIFFKQKIEPSLYERYSFINEENVSLIDIAAFFSSVKCFKYLLMMGANVEDTGKYAIAGGNLEIIHLCEQNHISFQNAYETAIIFHQNDIFKYLYENKKHLKKEINPNNIIKFGNLCIKCGNYEILSFLLKVGMKIDESMINLSAKIGNFYLVKYFLQNNKIPKNIFVFTVESGNIELVKYVLEQKVINLNSKNILLFHLIFILYF